MKKLCAVLVLALFALGLPGYGAQLSAEPPAAKEAPKKAPVPNPEFPKNYPLWMQLSFLADCTSENGKTYVYAVHGAVPMQAMVSLSRKEEQWASFVHWQDAHARYFVKKGDEIRTVKEKDDFMKEVARVAGPSAPSWMAAKDLPKGCAPKSPRGKGKLALLLPALPISPRHLLPGIRFSPCPRARGALRFLHMQQEELDLAFHYYGDLVRRIFLAIGLVILLSLPFVSSKLGVPDYLSVSFVLAITLLAGLMSRKNFWVAATSVAIAMAGITVFELASIEHYGGQERQLFVIDQGVALLFFFALYFAVKTLRSMRR